ncbi:Transcription factor subunit Med10 of Mediator complex [Cryptosporidium felis]|nr:Transcription factor subunit Med10 of Mediator complex [Cryptosporidium felis]
MENRVQIDPLLDCYIDIIKNLTILTNEIVSPNSNEAPNNSERIKACSQEYINLLVKAQNILPESELSKVEIPLGFIKHIDEGKSPNTWLFNLFRLLDDQKDRVRGEALSLSCLHRAICKRLTEKRELTFEDIDLIGETAHSKHETEESREG